MFTVLRVTLWASLMFYSWEANLPSSNPRALSSFSSLPSVPHRLIYPPSSLPISFTATLTSSFRLTAPEIRSELF